MAQSVGERRAGRFLPALLAAQNAGAVLAACAQEGVGYEGRTPARTAQLAYEMQAKAVDDGTKIGMSVADPVIITRLEQYALLAHNGRGTTSADKALARREFAISCGLTNTGPTCAALWSMLTRQRPASASPRVAARSTPRPSCAIPNAPARTLFAAKPTLPGDLADTHSGVVTVVVSLDSASQIVGTRVLRSTDPLLNESALAATRASRFATEIRKCRPIAEDFVFEVSFTLE